MINRQEQNWNHCTNLHVFQRQEAGDAETFNDVFHDVQVWKRLTAGTHGVLASRRLVKRHIRVAIASGRSPRRRRRSPRHAGTTSGRRSRRRCRRRSIHCQAERPAAARRKLKASATNEFSAQRPRSTLGPSNAAFQTAVNPKRCNKKSLPLIKQPPTASPPHAHAHTRTHTHTVLDLQRRRQQP